MPQTADFAEHYAIWVVAQRAHNPVEVVTDCNGVKASYEAGINATGPDRPHAGLWRTIRRDHISAVHKVKAHLTKDEADRRGMGPWWKGNYLVDLAAKQAAARLAPATQDVEDYHRRLLRATKLLALTATLLHQWPERPISLKTLDKAESSKGTAHLRRRHKYLWENVHQVFVCITCGRARRQGPPRRPTECRPLPSGDHILEKIHPTHDLWAAPVAGYGRPVVFCRVCKAYCTVKASLLHAPCKPPSVATERQYRYTIAVGRHPRTRARVLLKPYRLSLQAAAAAAATGTGEVPSSGAPLPVTQAAPRACWSAEELGLAGDSGEQLEAEELLDWFGPDAFEM
jgi:hypothetical protein